MTLGRRRVVRVPASTANLGPGFDVMAAALALHLELEVRETGSFAVHTELAVPRDRSNLIVQAFERLHPADAFEFHIASHIPLTGGLGSSAAAIVAGLVAADHLFELDADIRALATEIEGHPDNVSAAIDGGFVICAQDATHRFEPPMGLEAVLVIPDTPVRTAQARAALPATVPIADAVFNVAAAATLTARPGHRELGPHRRGAERPPAPASPGPSLSRARPSSWSTPPSTGRWGPRSPARAPPSWCGAPTSRPAR